MRPVTGLAAIALLALTACSPGGTPAPSSVTITPSLHRVTPATTTSSAAPGVRPSRRPVEPARTSLLLTTERVGTLALGSASPADAGSQLDALFGKPTVTTTCGGSATIRRWSALTMTFAGTPEVARSWEVTVEGGTAHLRLARGTEWSPELDALLERPDATRTTSGKEVTVTLADGLRYRFGEDRRARTVGAGPPACS